jgi:hypothetical protein
MSEHDDDYYRRIEESRRYQERIDESNEYLDRRQDQVDWETEQRERSDEFWTAIREGDESKLRWMFDVPPADEAGAASNFDAAPARPPSAEEQFSEHRASLSVELELSHFLSRQFTAWYIEQLEALEVHRPDSGLVVLRVIEDDVLRALREAKPQRDVFSLSIADEMAYDEHVREVETELEWLKRILEHVQRLQQQ